MANHPATGNRAREWRWNRNHREERIYLAQELGVTPTLAGLLIARGCADVEAAHRFLHPSLDQLHDPFLLPDVEAAVERIARAVRDGERILVHGDYDVDGIAAAALMARVLRILNANVAVFVPDRHKDGYDLQVDTVRRVASEGVQLILTVDCGIVAFEAAEAARELGVDLIVTDHHEPHPDRLPTAVAVVNPKRPGSNYPFPGLCGAGVAYKLAHALLRHMEVPDASFRRNFLDLVALGTVADCMPLLEENRVLVAHGVSVLRETRKPGLKALLQVAEVKQVTARAIAFALGPRLNAAGRVGAAELALSLLLANDVWEARDLAQRLDRLNKERQQEQQRIQEEALELARELDPKVTPVVVLAASNWHAGIIGIAANKVAETLGRPAVLIALEGAQGRGSARSIPGFHIQEALARCSEHLLRYGGHEAAAGFDILAASVPAFREAITAVAAERISPEMLAPALDLDDVLEPEEITMALARELQLLEPCGNGNAWPLFGSRALPVHETRLLPAKVTGAADHLKLRLRLTAPGSETRSSPSTEHRAPSTERSEFAEAMFWRHGHLLPELEGQAAVDLCYRLEIDTYWGDERLRLNIHELRGSDTTP
jgi:single-stranded-DNA-specific exonuclease